MAVIVSTRANYWISPTALSITLNALGEPNRIQASVASGAVIMCYIRGVEGLDFDNGHNYRRWPLTISPTYFNSNTEKYLYVAIPRSNTIGSDAMVVFPSQKLDIYGYAVEEDPETHKQSQGEQLGTDGYYYIWLQGIITSSGDGGNTPREWREGARPDTGILRTDEATDSTETHWYRWDPITQTVTFLKDIWMDATSVFKNLQLTKMIFNGHELNGVAVKDVTPSDSDDTIVTPAYLDGLTDGKYLRKDQDDRTEYSLGIGGELSVDGTTFANGGVRANEVRSDNYTGDSIADTGFLLTVNSNGHSKLTIDEIYVRMKAVFESLEVKKWSVNAGDEIWSCAANVINRVDYYADASQAPLGYSYVRVPWLLKGIPFILSKFSEGLGRKMYAALAKVRRNLTDEQLKQVRFCRCYFLANDGQTEIDNWWQQDDLARCQTMNVRNTARETYTAVQQKAGNVFWWRKVVRVSSSPVELEQGKSYHYFDVAYNYEAEKNDTASVYALYGSDIPAAGDHAVQFGNTVVPGRMNLMMIQVNGGSELTYDPNSDAPCIKAYKGIYCFNLDKCWFGGLPLKMKLSPSTGYLFYGPEFKVVKEYGVVPVPTQRGAWVDIDLETDHYTRSSVIPYSDDIVTQSSRKRWDGGSTDRVRKCYYYDEVSHKGCTWLCSIADDAHWVADETFTAGAKTFTKDKRITDADYAALSPEDKVKCSRKPNYTADEPSDLSPDWRKLVDRGTSVTSVTTKYGKSDQGTDHTRVEQWVTLDHIADLALKNGDYMWTWTHTEYSDTLEPTDVYYASRWGIDGDGIASINSYYWGTSDTALVMNAAKDAELGLYMPGDSHWAGAGPESKWFDQFGTMATANGGVGAMQGWNVWQKTVIHYDLPEGRSPSEQKPDIVNYTMSRLGIDGMMVQEEYYCLRDSDQFATAFGGYTYDKCGIRYYKLTGGVPDENGRLSTTTPNVNTDIWTNQMPVYDNSTPDKAKKKFLWNFEQRADGQGTEFASRPICIGDHSRGIKGVLELYALSASGTPQSNHHIPDDIWAANNNSETDYSKSDPTKPKTWTDELADRAPTEALPYQWNWTRTLYTTPLNAADTQKDPTTGWWYEDHWHVSAVRGTKGEDGAGTEYIYCRPQSHNADGTPLTVTLPDPNILKDKDGVVRTAAYIKQTDDFIPYEYTDNPVGIDFRHQIEYQCERKSTATTGAGGFTGGHEWGAFSSPKPWSKWGKNGMDGDGTEYVFIRTTKNVAPVLSSATATDSGGRSATDAEYLPLISNISACGAETNGKAGECTDDPKGCTRDWPYEWVAKRTMTLPNAESGQRVWKTYYASVGSPYKMSPWSNYAENSMRLDLSNEMDMVQTDSTGKILAARTVETLVYFYDGAKEITLGDNDLTVTGGPDVTSANKIATFSNTASGNARKLSWAFIAGKTMAAAYNITVSFTYLGVTHTVTFTVGASTGQPIYQLKPRINVIAFSRKANNALDPASRKFTLSVVKIDGSSTTELPVPGGLPAGFSVRFSTVSMPASATAGTAWGTADGTSGITWSGAEMTVANSVAIGEIFIAMFNTAGTLLDRETVPVMKDGANGEGIQSVTKWFQATADNTAPTTPAQTSQTGWTRNAAPTDWSASKKYLWCQEDTLLTDGTTHKWSAVYLHSVWGEQGPQGNPAKDYSLQCSPGSVNFRSDATGTISGSIRVTCEVMKTVGMDLPVKVNQATNGSYDGLFLGHRFCKGDGTFAGWVENSASCDVSAALLSPTYNVNGVEFALATDIHMNNIVVRTTVPVSRDGHIGPSGETGKMFYVQGEWKSNIEYSRTELLVPLVHYDDGTFSEATGQGNYYYLVADSNQGTIPGTNEDVWKKANGFGVVITQGLFADFAKFGKGIISGDCMFSADGQLDGKTIENYAKWKGITSYILFAGDPDAFGMAVSGAASINYTSYARLHTDSVQLTKGSEVVFKLSVSSGSPTAQVGISTITSQTPSIGFKYSEDNSDSWSGPTNLLTVYAGHTYYLRFTPSMDYGYFISAKKAASGTGSMTYALSRVLFEPNWWVDLLTGKMVAARGHFAVEPDGNVRVEGTVRANNLYHGVCVVGKEEYFYCTQDFLDDYALEAWIGHFTLGKYYTQEQIYELSNHEIGNPRGVEGHGPVACTYMADIVICPNRYNNSNPRSVVLPCARDFEGKIVEVIDNAYVSSPSIMMGNIVVSSADNGYFSDGIGTNGPQDGQSNTQSVINPGGSARYYSIKGSNGIWYWLKLGGYYPNTVVVKDSGGNNMQLTILRPT